MNDFDEHIDNLNAMLCDITRAVNERPSPSDLAGEPIDFVIANTLSELSEDLDEERAERKAADKDNDRKSNFALIFGIAGAIAGIGSLIFDVISYFR